MENIIENWTNQRQISKFLVIKIPEGIFLNLIKKKTFLWEQTKLEKI